MLVVVHAASRMLCEPNNVVYNCEFLKSCQQTGFVQDILDSLSRSIEGPIGLLTGLKR